MTFQWIFQPKVTSCKTNLTSGLNMFFLDRKWRWLVKTSLLFWKSHLPTVGNLVLRYLADSVQTCKIYKPHTHRLARVTLLTSLLSDNRYFLNDIRPATNALSFCPVVTVYWIARFRFADTIAGEPCSQWHYITGCNFADNMYFICSQLFPHVNGSRKIELPSREGMTLIMCVK